MKNFCERLAMRATTTMLSGRVSTMTSVRIQLIVSIITMTPMSVSTDVSSCVSVLLQRAADAVEVVHGAAHHLAARSRIEELQRQPVELGFDLPAHGVDGLLRDVGHQVLHQVLKGCWPTT